MDIFWMSKIENRFRTLKNYFKNSASETITFNLLSSVDTECQEENKIFKTGHPKNILSSGL